MYHGSCFRVWFLLVAKLPIRCPATGWAGGFLGVSNACFRVMFVGRFRAYLFATQAFSCVASVGGWVVFLAFLLMRGGG